MRSRLVAATAAVGALALGVGVLAVADQDDSGGGSAGSRPFDLGGATRTAALVPFGDCDAFTTWVKGEALERVGPYGLGGGGWRLYNEGIALMADGAKGTDYSTAAPTAGSGAGTDYSTTNVQVAGVDEPDVVKTDGEIIVTVANGRLYVVDAASKMTLGSVDLGDASARDLLIEGDRVLVMGGWGGPVMFDDVVVEPLPEPMPAPGVEPKDSGTDATGTTTVVDEPADGASGGASGSSTGSVGGDPVADPGSDDSDLIDPTGGDATTATSGPDRPVSSSTDAAPDSAVGDAPLPEPPLGAPGTRSAMTVAPDIMPWYGGTLIVEVDISDRSAPEVTERVRLDGAYVSARLVDGVARIVVNGDVGTSLAFVQPVREGKEAEQVALEQNRTVIEQSDASDWLPTWRPVDAQGEPTGEAQPLLACDEAARPERFGGFGMLSVLTVDLGEGLRAGLEDDGGAGVVGSGEQVYSSPEHLYVSTAEYVDWERLSPEQQARVDQQFGTSLHRFDITDPDATVYEGSGRVDGTLLNQYSMDEYDDVLRVATTKGSPWSVGPQQQQSQSLVTTLALRDGELVELGRVGGLGVGETIQSVRFIGPVGYVVTFRQTDPLYTVDLSDPAAPEVVGELKIPGYSAYLHPVGDGYLLGVGVDADAQGRRTGMQVSLFDVRDPADPTRLDVVTIPDAGSAVEYDPRAFLWWPTGEGTGMAVFPIDSWTGEGPFGTAVVFDVDTGAGTVTERGRVGQDPTGRRGKTEYFAPVDRSLVIGDELWTRSDAGLQANEMESLDAVAFVGFTVS